MPYRDAIPDRLEACRYTADPEAMLHGAEERGVMVEMNDEKPTGPDVCEHVVGMRDGSFTFGRMGRGLPHLLKEGGTFFVTFCLQDAVPSKLAKRAEIATETTTDRIAERSEPIADRGSLILRRPEIG